MSKGKVKGQPSQNLLIPAELYFVHFSKSRKTNPAKFYKNIKLQYNPRLTAHAKTELGALVDISIKPSTSKGETKVLEQSRIVAQSHRTRRSIVL